MVGADDLMTMRGHDAGDMENTLAMEASSIMDQNEDDSCGCSLCVGDVPDQIVEQAMASAAHQGPPMSAAEFRQWLDAFEPISGL